MFTIAPIAPIAPQVTEYTEGLAFEVAPVSTTTDLQKRWDELPGESSWCPGLCLPFHGFKPCHNGTRPGEYTPALQCVDVVSVCVDRSDPEDPTGGTAVVRVNGAVLLGPIALGYTEDAVVVDTMAEPNAIRIVEYAKRREEAE